MAAFLARGDVPADSPGDHLFKQTTSTCPTCLTLLPADVVIRAGRVYFKKTCATCGPSEALVSEDAGYYVRAYGFARAGTEPLKFAGQVEHGCPTDCGTCDDHEQHTCLPIVEITDHCNLECPICIVDNQYANHMEPETFARIVDGLIANEGQCESIALSGGEPTSHPRLLELIDIATRDEIGRIVIITNGLRLGRDRAFAEALKAKGAYVALQLDGFNAETHEKIRGRDLTAEKEAALAMLKELAIPTQLIFVATRGVNEHQIGHAVDLLESEDHILSLSFQPAAFTGHGGGRFPHDPMDRLTIPGVIHAIEAQTAGVCGSRDFSPLPCSHPQCVSLTYLLRLPDGSHLPFARFVDFKRHGSLLRSSATLGASPEIHDTLQEVIHDVFARQDEIEHGPAILKSLRRSLDAMFPGPRAQQQGGGADRRAAGEVDLPAPLHGSPRLRSRAAAQVLPPLPAGRRARHARLRLQHVSPRRRQGPGHAGRLVGRQALDESSRGRRAPHRDRLGGRLDVGSVGSVGLLDGRVALVTGATRGLGRAIARTLAREGADVAFNYTRADAEAATLVEEIRRRRAARAAVQGLGAAIGPASRRWCGGSRPSGLRSTCWSTTPASGRSSRWR